MLALLDTTGVPLDFAVFGPQAAGVSAGRDEQGKLIFFERPTPGKLVGADIDAIAEQQIASIRISEVHFNPSEEEDEEFIELTNIGQAAVPLQGLTFAQGIEWESDASELAHNESIVVVKDRKAFRQRYGKNIRLGGEFRGKLSNGGERLQLTTSSGVTICDINYSDKWHAAADGKGKSLEVIDLRASRFDRKNAWRASASNGGSPGKTQS